METKKYLLVNYSREPDSDIVYCEYNPKLKIDLPIALELTQNYHDFTASAPIYLITDFSGIERITAEAKLYWESEKTGITNLLGVAFIASNPVSALIANLFVKKPRTVLLKYFSDKKAALIWINELKEKQNLLAKSGS
jgi:hypothetical protein